LASFTTYAESEDTSAAAGVLDLSTQYPYDYRVKCNAGLSAAHHTWGLWDDVGERGGGVGVLEPGHSSSTLRKVQLAFGDRRRTVECADAMLARHFHSLTEA
jgi:hypothetical protein